MEYTSDCCYSSGRLGWFHSPHSECYSCEFTGIKSTDTMWKMRSKTEISILNHTMFYSFLYRMRARWANLDTIYIEKVVSLCSNVPVYTRKVWGSFAWRVWMFTQLPPPMSKYFSLVSHYRTHSKWMVALGQISFSSLLLFNFQPPYTNSPAFKEMV